VGISTSQQTTTKGARWGSFEFFLYFTLEMNLTAISKDFRYVMMAWYQALATCQKQKKTHLQIKQQTCGSIDQRNIFWTKETETVG
jgi:hypothetical protein